MDNNEDKNKQEFSGNQISFTLLDIIIIFLKNKKRIFIISGIICIISIILYFFVFDLIYYSEASIKSSGKSGGLLGSLTEGLSDFSDLDPFSVGGKSAKELAAYDEILRSRRCLEPLVEKFDLINRDNYKFKEDAIKDFRERKMTTEYAKLSGVMNVGVYDKDPVKAKEMVDFLLEELDKINIEMNVLNAKNNREFIEKRYFQAKQDLTNAEDSLKSFQMIYGVAPDLRIKAASQSVFALEAELKTEEVKLDVLKKILSADQPEVKTQQAKVSILKDKISGIQTSTDLTDILSLGNSPQIAISYLRLQRELEIQTKILTFLLPIYEQAKIEEKKETPTILILDKPFVSERKSKPKRLTMVVIITFLAVIASLTYYVFKEKWLRFKNSDTFKNIKSS